MRDKKAEFLKYFEPINKSLSNFARAMCRNPEDAKDIVSETILVTYNNWDKIKDKSAVKSYMFSTAHRLAKRYYKKHSNQILIDDFEKMENLLNKTDDPNYDIKLLYKLLDQLPPKQKEAIILFEISDLSIEEIAKIQGGTLSGVKSRLKRGREKLTELLKKDIKIYNGKSTGASNKFSLINLKVVDE